LDYLKADSENSNPIEARILFLAIFSYLLFGKNQSNCFWFFLLLPATAGLMNQLLVEAIKNSNGRRTQNRKAGAQFKCLGFGFGFGFGLDQTRPHRLEFPPSPSD